MLTFKCLFSHGAFQRPPAPDSPNQNPEKHPWCRNLFQIHFMRWLFVFRDHWTVPLAPWHSFHRRQIFHRHLTHLKREWSMENSNLLQTLKDKCSRSTVERGFYFIRQMPRTVSSGMDVFTPKNREWIWVQQLGSCGSSMKNTSSCTKMAERRREQQQKRCLPYDVAFPRCSDGLRLDFGQIAAETLAASATNSFMPISNRCR